MKKNRNYQWLARRSTQILASGRKHFVCCNAKCMGTQLFYLPYTLQGASYALVRCTQGVLASKFPISIRTLTQGQYRCQKVRKILKNHLPVSDFATMLLNLRKTQKSRNFCKTIFFLEKMEFDIKGTIFRIPFFHP